jgi:hypothetical protein
MEDERNDPLEEEDEEISIEERNISTDPGDPEIESLYGKYKRGKLELQSYFQRFFVWDHKRASLLIESALLGIPLPIIYLSEEKDGKEVVIDGQQRLTSFFSFIDGHYPNGQPFRLTFLKAFPELKGKSYKELSESLQDKIRYCHIRTITFKKDSSPELKFEIFERLNSGAEKLNAQELRNCIYRGTYNDLLKNLAASKDFISIVPEDPKNRMKNIEHVLRFSAFFHSSYLNYSPPMPRFLNKEMEKYRKINENDANELINAFKNAVSINKSLFGSNAFKRFYSGNIKNHNGNWEPKQFNASLFDVMMYTFAMEDKNVVLQNADVIRESLINLMINDNEFIDSIELATSNRQRVLTRFDKWRIALQNIIGVNQKEPRCFSRTIKEQLFRLDNTCAICGQKIIDIDDSAVDHIEQYWLGGKTIPENARLTHRFCNSARPRNDGSNNFVNIQTVPKSIDRPFEYSGRKHRSPSGHSTIIVTLNWKEVGKERESEIIDEGVASKTMVKTLERIGSVLGSDKLELVLGQMSGKKPLLSKNPEEDYFIQESGRTYSYEAIPNTNIYVCTHTNTIAKKMNYKRLCEY